MLVVLCLVNMLGMKMKCLDVVRINLLVILIMVGVVFGFVVGFVVREYNLLVSVLMWIGKYIFLRFCFLFVYNFLVIIFVCINIYLWCVCIV